MLDIRTSLQESELVDVQKLLGSVMTEHSLELPSDVVRLVIEQQGEALRSGFLNVLRNCVESQAGVAIRMATVDYGLHPQKIWNAIDRIERAIGSTFVIERPSGCVGTKDVVVEFFELKCYPTRKVVDQACAERGLRPDLYAQIKVNIEDPTFADAHPNAIFLDNVNGELCSMRFGVRHDKLRDSSDRYKSVCDAEEPFTTGWWFGGVRD